MTIERKTTLQRQTFNGFIANQKKQTTFDRNKAAHDLK